MPISNPIGDLLVGEGHISLLCFNYNSTPQGTWLFTVGASGEQALGYLQNAGSYGDGDNFTLKAYVEKGTYSMRLLYYADSMMGIIDIDIDAVEKGSIDAYNAGALYNQVYTVTGIVIADSGLKTITVRIDGKNGSSSQFGAFVSCLTLWRTV